VAAAGLASFDGGEEAQRPPSHQAASIRALVDILVLFVMVRRLGDSSAGGSTVPGAPGLARLPPAPMPDWSSADGLSDRGDSASPESHSIRHAVARRRRPDWPSSRGPAPKRPADSGDRCDPCAPSMRESDPWRSPADPRRCVGGYPVPLDPAVPFSPADYVPIRLRPDDSGIRLSRAAAAASSPFPPACDPADRAQSIRYSKAMDPFHHSAPHAGEHP
jgi:hypothetical protein